MFGKKDPSKSPRETNGPVVKTGPTKGENRSRNKDGRWSAKRSDSGKKRDSSCFLTTAACSYKGLPDDCFELEVLRNFRDEVLLSTEEGRLMMEQYYAIAPKLCARLVLQTDFDYVWKSVRASVFAIQSKKHEEALLIYKEMVSSLEERLSRP